MAIGQQDVNVVFLLCRGPLVRLFSDRLNALYAGTYVMMYTSGCHILNSVETSERRVGLSNMKDSKELQKHMS